MVLITKVKISLNLKGGGRDGGLRERLKWKAHSPALRGTRTWNGKRDLSKGERRALNIPCSEKLGAPHLKGDNKKYFLCLWNPQNPCIMLINKQKQLKQLIK